MPLDSNIPTPKDLKEYMDKASTVSRVLNLILTQKCKSLLQLYVQSW